MEQILYALSTDERVSEILRRLKNGETYDSIVEWLGRASMDDFDISSTFVASDHEMGGVSSSFQWTAVTAESAVLDHLFQLYFSWVHPVHTLFSEGHFVDSYKRQSHQYCSSLLVNSLCAMACHLHTSANTDEVDFGQLRLIGLKGKRRRGASGVETSRSTTRIQRSQQQYLQPQGSALMRKWRYACL